MESVVIMLWEAGYEMIVWEKGGREGSQLDPGFILHEAQYTLRVQQISPHVMEYPLSILKIKFPVHSRERGPQEFYANHDPISQLPTPSRTKAATQTFHSQIIHRPPSSSPAPPLPTFAPFSSPSSQPQPSSHSPSQNNAPHYSSLPPS